ncbi:MAG: aromatic ring-hydroxylating dioxygenase subunit alpha [Sphingomonadales bacterium]
MPETNQSLPAWTYRNAEFFELEAEALFRSSWQLVCHLSNIPQVGDYFTFDLLGDSLFVIRQKAGNGNDAIGAFHNVCRHRASRLLDGPSGNVRRRITCPYHAWAYERDGSLAVVPFREQFEGLDPAKHCLAPVVMEIFAGFIFLRITDDGGPSVAEQFAPVMDELSLYRLEELSPMGRVTLRPRPVNWKQIADNYVDALHIPVAHPGLSSLVGNSYAIDVAGDIHIMTSQLKPTPKAGWSERAYSEILPRIDHLPGPAGRRWLYYRMWPNLAFELYPDQISFMQFIPISATESLIREIPYALPDDRREMHLARYLNWRINRVVNAEDTELVARVQAGMSSASFTSGHFAKTEVCLIDSARRIRAALPIAACQQEPEPGTMADLNREMAGETA